MGYVDEGRGPGRLLGSCTRNAGMETLKEELMGTAPFSEKWSRRLSREAKARRRGFNCTTQNPASADGRLLEVSRLQVPRDLDSWISWVLLT